MPVRFEKNKNVLAVSYLAFEAQRRPEMIEILEVWGEGRFLGQQMINARDCALAIAAWRTAPHSPRLPHGAACIG